MLLNAVDAVIKNSTCAACRLYAITTFSCYVSNLAKMRGAKIHTQAVETESIILTSDARTDALDGVSSLAGMIHKNMRLFTV